MKAERLRAVTFDLCGLAPGAPVIVGVSGGPDSLCLLHSLSQMGLPVTAAHFDHALRHDSAEDAAFVRETAARLGVPFITRREDASLHAQANKMSLEEAARHLRYRFLFDAARQAGAQAVAVGHNADDQVETLLMHLLRGSGVRGLAGMPYRAALPDFDARIPLARPLLPFWRKEILAYCADHGLEPRFDASNQDTAFFRNRLRHELIPLLEQYNPRVREALWRTAQIAAAELEVVDSAAQAAWQSVFAGEGQGAVALRAAPLREHPPGMRLALLRRAIARVQPALRDVDFAAANRAQQALMGTVGGMVNLVHGITAFIEGDRLWIARPGARFSDEWPVMDAEQALLPIPGSAALAQGWRLTAVWEEPGAFPPGTERAITAMQARLHGEGITSPLVVRPAHPGDRFAPLGMQGHTLKLSDFWINQKLPRRARAHYPLVLANNEIAWIPGFRLSHAFRVREDTHRVLLLRLERERDA